MGKFAIQTLEFNKVKELLARKTATGLAKEQAMSLRIESEFSAVKRLQEETAEALRLLDEGKRFPLGGAYNITDSVKRAKLGSVLDVEDLMQIGTTLSAIRQVKFFLAEETEIAPTLAEFANEMAFFTKLEKQILNAISEKGEVMDSAIGFQASGTDVTSGLYGFSAVLTGIALGCTFYKPNLRSAIWTVLGIIVTVFVQGAMNALLGPFGIATLTAPFCITTWLFLLPRLNIDNPTPHDESSKHLRPDHSQWHKRKDTKRA